MICSLHRSSALRHVFAARVGRINSLSAATSEVYVPDGGANRQKTLETYSPLLPKTAEDSVKKTSRSLASSRAFSAALTGGLNDLMRSLRSIAVVLKMLLPGARMDSTVCKTGHYAWSAMHCISQFPLWLIRLQAKGIQYNAGIARPMNGLLTLSSALVAGLSGLLSKNRLTMPLCVCESLQSRTELQARHIWC